MLPLRFLSRISLNYALAVLVSSTAVITASMMLAPSSRLEAAEISVLSGLYQYERHKINGNGNGDKSTMTLGGRYTDMLSQDLAWFAQGGLTRRAYSAPEVGKAPDDSITLNLQGGVRYYFLKWGEKIRPYVAGAFGYQDDKNADLDAKIQTEKSGIYYWGYAGIRFGLDPRFFMELESTVFQSALLASEKSQDFEGKTKTEIARTEFYVDTFAPMNQVVVSLGLRL